MQNSQSAALLGAAALLQSVLKGQLPPASWEMTHPLGEVRKGRGTEQLGDRDARGLRYRIRGPKSDLLRGFALWERLQ